MFFRKECKECAGHKAEIGQLRVKLAQAETKIAQLTDSLDAHATRESDFDSHQSANIRQAKKPEISGHTGELDKQHATAAAKSGMSNRQWLDQKVEDHKRRNTEMEQNHDKEKNIVSEEKGRKASLADGYKTLDITSREKMSTEAPKKTDNTQESDPLNSSERANANAVRKFRMSNEDRARLLKKRAELKAKLGPNAEESREIRDERARDKQIAAIKEASELHFSALLRNFRRSQIYNDYNVLISDGRMIECHNFLHSLGLKTNRLAETEAFEIIVSTVTGLQAQQFADGLSVEDYPEDGWDFEHWVADALERYDWQARATQGSGDQGVDVVATKNGVSLGIQCKRYTGSVGNKAIQEAYSGMKHFGLDKAAVLTNAEFTKSAKELAASTGVLLLSPEDIPTLSERPELGI